MPDEPFDWSAIRTKCECGREMVARQNHENGNRFMGCSNYPACTNTAPIPAYAILKAQGAASLPGFD